MTKLYAPESYWTAHKGLKKEHCNGCGTKGLGGWITPDTLYGLCISEACDIHDWMYAFGKKIEDKEEADRVFLNNLVRIINGGSRWLMWIRRQRAMKYYSAVKDFGGPAFWRGKNKRSEMR